LEKKFRRAKIIKSLLYMGKYFALSLALPQEEKIKPRREFSKKTLKHFKRLNFSLNKGNI